MGAPRTKVMQMDFDVIVNLKHACYGQFGRFYQDHIFPCKWFTRVEFTRAMNHDFITPEKYRDMIFTLQWIHEKINAHRSDPKHHMAPLIPDIIGDSAQQEDPIRYLVVTGQGKTPVTLESLNEKEEA